MAIKTMPLLLIWHRILYGCGMSLAKYKQKRKFDKTPEPTGGNPTGNSLRFVVQKHHASHMHYDFRLEMEGVLKSWAVPKGPSMNPQDKRLAMKVEDHPWDYRNFEGIIPSGYGAGTVIVWDEGEYEPDEKKKTKKENEKSLLYHLYQGAISFTLKGKKLKGSFSLVKTKDRGENSWLLIKKKDKYASSIDITTKNKSVLSNKTLEQVAANPEREWESHKPSKQSGKDKGVQDTVALIDQIKAGTKSSMPSEARPMLCTLTREPFNDENYLYEFKLDGYRIISYKSKASIRMASRSGLDYTSKYPLVADALKKLKHDAVFDGEMIVINKQGNADFDSLQKYNGVKTPIAYFIFDVIWIDGYDVKSLPLVDRKLILQTLLKDNLVLRYNDSYDDGLALYKEAQQKGVEGIVAKRKDSAYIENDRSSNWYKIPTTIRQEFVIGGWAESDRGRSFRSLLFGAYNKDGQLEWIGRSGGGYKEKEMPGILKQLKALEIDKSPFINKVLDTKGAAMHYVKPKLVANFQFATWTTSGRIRKPATFLGFRKDKNAKQVVREIPREVVTNDLSQVRAKKLLPASTGSHWPEIENQEITSDATFNLGSCDIQIQNIERELWKGITKAELIQYYHSIASFILPHLQHRPLSLHVKPVDANGPGFYIKDMEGRQPGCSEIFHDKRKHPKKGKGSVIDYLVCNNEETLLYMVNLGCIDINPWTSRTTTNDHPDYIIIDLDPSDNDFQKAVETAIAAKKMFDKYKLEAFAKTSGQTGIHIYIPCKGFTFPDARAIAAKICDEIHHNLPKITTTNSSVSKRGNKLYIDPNQNDYADTVAAPYAVRPFHIPTVSTPLEWKEIKGTLDTSNFTIKTIAGRLRKKGDLFKDILNEKVRESNSKILRQFL